MGHVIVACITLAPAQYIAVTFGDLFLLGGGVKAIADSFFNIFVADVIVCVFGIFAMGVCLTRKQTKSI